jgi:Spy/CpxP family protein refolding chaperone
MTRHILSFVTVLGLSLSIAAAQPGSSGGPEGRHPGPGMGQHSIHEHMMQKLNLTDQQREQVEKLRAAFEKKEIAAQAKIRSLRVDLKQAAVADNPDRAAIEKIVGSISDQQHQAKMDLIDHLFAVRAILTPEQQKVWKSELLRMGMESGRRMRGGMMQHGLRGEGPAGEAGGLYGDRLEG